MRGIGQTIKLRDSRRLTGPNLFRIGPGAVVEVSVADEQRDALLAAWQSCVRRMVEALGWEREKVAWRIEPGGASFAFSAPLDMLFVATDVNEWALMAAGAALVGEPEPSFEDACEELATACNEARNPALLQLAKGASAHGVLFVCDDVQASVGVGAGSRTWPVDELPAPENVAWNRIHDIPLTLVSGTNGKTTTVHMLRAMIRAAGRVPGCATSDGVTVGDELVVAGDYTGGGGANHVLRDPRVEYAVLEVSRGGMLRRGLPVARTDVAVVTNVARDYARVDGPCDLQILGEAHLLVAKRTRCLVANADDDTIMRACPPEQGCELFLFSLAGLGRLGQSNGCTVDSGRLVLRRAGIVEPLIDIAALHAGLGGAALHNIANAAAAAAAALALDLPVQAIRTGLMEFDSSPANNPGRLNVFRLNQLTIIVDGALNGFAVSAVLETVGRLAKNRLLVVLGQAGDRDDESIREVARIVRNARPDRVIVKEMRGFLRGRRLGEVPQLLVEVLQADNSDGRISLADNDLDAVRQALEWSRSGDVLLLLSHGERGALLTLLGRLQEQRWQPGERLVFD